MRSPVNEGVTGNATNNDMQARVIYINNASRNAEFCDNSITTSKYTIWTFLPRFLKGRFMQTANCYFLLVGIGQLIPAITSTHSIPYQWIVLSLVLSIDAGFAAIEDRKRHIADKKINTRLTSVYDTHAPLQFRSKAWKDVCVGDILQLHMYEQVPADILLLAVSEPDPSQPVGTCFVETKSLDGETNLKVRQAMTCTFTQLNDPTSLGNLPGIVYTEIPNHDVNNFVGRYEPRHGHTIPIDLKNIALRGSVIRNTNYIYGLVLNTGKDTKIMQSASAPATPKVSRIFTIINNGIIILMIILVLLALIGSLFCVSWVANNRNTATYLRLNDLSGVAPFRHDIIGWIIFLGYYWILIASFVPITLYVTTVIVKSYQAYFINRDLEMYDETTDTPALVRNSELIDNLGQITHILSDKTGTLTANVMDFRKMCVNGISYGRGTTEIGREVQRRLGKQLNSHDVLADKTPQDKFIPNVRFLDPEREYERDSDMRINPIQAKKIQEFLIHLAICHSVVVEDNFENLDEIKYSASSPDELALVSGAKYLGYTFKSRKNGLVTIQIPLQLQKMTFEVLEIIGFTSSRKRMSVIVRSPDNRILLFTKGADTAIFSRLHRAYQNSHNVVITTELLEKYASEGLRTLVIAKREIPEKLFHTWSKEYNHARSDLEELYKQKQGDKNSIEVLENAIESDLELLGATGIEDRLQEGVTSTLNDLGQTGIKVWVLTGDKEETAINIGFACQLIDNNMERVIINTENYPSVHILYDMLLYRCQEVRSHKCHNLLVSSKEHAVIIDGNSLAMIFAYPILEDLFVEFAQQASALICCRVTPKQKAQVVCLLKAHIPNSVTLAIGDGANDVSMIQESHVGIGISGLEGMQAVNASDFAIAQFRFLKRMILVHGRWNYRRMAKLTLYIVYKNILLYFTQFVLALLTGGSGTLYFNNMWINGYNIFWTSLPIIVVGIWDEECPAEIALNFPALYYSGIHSEHFNIYVIVQWIAEALYEGLICALVPYFLMNQINSNGIPMSKDVCGAMAYCSMLMVGWLKLMLNVTTWNFLTVSAFLISFLSWFISGIIIDICFPTSIASTAFPYVLGLPEFYLALYLAILLCLGRDLIYKAIKREFEPEYYHILREMHGNKSDANLAHWSPPKEMRRHAKRHRFQADLTNLLPSAYMGSSFLSRNIPALSTKSSHNRIASNYLLGPDIENGKNYTGFAFSTQVFEDRFINPLRDLVLPMSMARVVDALSQTLNDLGTNPLKASPSKRKTKASHADVEGDKSNNIDCSDIQKGQSEPITYTFDDLISMEQEDRDANFAHNFEDKISLLPIECQSVFEIQRFQVFTGWGSSRPGHLLMSDPPRFTNSAMDDGIEAFELSENWVLDTQFGGNDHWQYAAKFEDFRLQQNTQLALTQREKLNSSLLANNTISTSRRLVFNKLVGRCVRRRRWIRKFDSQLEGIKDLI